MEQRANKFYYKLGKTATEMHEILVKVSVGKQKMCLRFREGKETTEDEPRSGWPSISRNDRESATNADTRSATDAKIDWGGIGFSKDTAHTIVRDDLGKRKICSQFVPHKLTDE